MSDEQSIRDDIRSAYVRPVNLFGGYGAEHRAELFDAWERRIQAEALREAADDWHEKHAGTRPAPYLFMVDRADAIERGETS